MGRRSPITAFVAMCGKSGYPTRTQAERAAKTHARRIHGCRKCRTGYAYRAYRCREAVPEAPHFHTGHAWSKQMKREMAPHRLVLTHIGFGEGEERPCR